MVDCRHCGEYMIGEASKYGARCPRCREPLYERPDGVRRHREAQESRGGVCALHPGNVAVAPCKRCGTFMCGLCRSKWEERVFCLACIERLMGGDDTPTEDVQTQRWQALISVLLGFAGWVLALPMVVVANAGASREVVIGMIVLAVASFLPSLFGLGQAASAIRLRGDRMVLATCGLALTGAQIGTVTGFVLLVIWKQ